VQSAVSVYRNIKTEILRKIMPLPASTFELSSDRVYSLMSVEEIQKALGRSRASIYRYANTDPVKGLLNVPYDPTRLNPELRQSDRDPLLFHPTEVSRFARDVLKI